MAVMWPRGNRYGLWAALIVTTAVSLWTEAQGWSIAYQIAAYLPAGVVVFILASLLTPAEPEDRIRAFYLLLRTPVGEEHRLHEAGVEVLLAGESSGQAGATRGGDQEGQGLILVDVFSGRPLSFLKYRVDILGFLAATVLILLIIGIGVLFAQIGG
jgi:hypothetical protein